MRALISCSTGLLGRGLYLLGPLFFLFLQLLQPQGPRGSSPRLCRDAELNELNEDWQPGNGSKPVRAKEHPRCRGGCHKDYIKHKGVWQEL